MARLGRAARPALLGLVTALLSGSLAAVVGPLVTAPVAAPARADTTFGAPSWWRGDCDTDNWTAKARAAGWTGEAAHRLGGQVLGIPVCGPRNLAGGPNVWWSRPGWGELEWQCVEFAQRFMIQVYGTQPYQGNGVDIVRNYTTARGGGLVRVDNGTVGRAPAAGDIVSFSSPSNVYGHVAVVASSSVDANGNGSVRLATQNDTVDGWRTLAVTGWKMAAFGSLYPYAWLHDPLGRGGSGLSDGAFVVHDGAVYRLAGGAPVYVSSWTPFGGARPMVTLTDDQWAALRAVPRDRTFLRDPVSGRIYTVVGGRAVYVTSCAPPGLAGCGAAVEVDPAAIAHAGEGSVWDHLRATIADGTFVRVADGDLTGLVTRAAGGSLLWLTDCAPWAGCSGYVDVNGASFADYAAAHPTPVDGTVVTGLPSTVSRAFTGGVCRLVTAAATGAVVVNDASLAPCTPTLRAAAPATTLLVGRPVSMALVATGGSGAYAWSATTALPPGLALATDGTLTGTPTAVGAVPVGVHLVDTRYPTETLDATLTFTVTTVLTATPLTLDLPVGAAPFALPTGATGAAGGTGPYSYTVVGGTLPAGVTLGRDGTLSGGAPGVGSWTLTLAVTDASTPAMSVTLRLTLTGVPGGGLDFPAPGGLEHAADAPR